MVRAAHIVLVAVDEYYMVPNEISVRRVSEIAVQPNPNPIPNYQPNPNSLVFAPPGRSLGPGSAAQVS